MAIILFLKSVVYAGVEATDWSWGALIFDMDNDGYARPFHVANGIYKDLLDLDYVNFMSQPGQIKNIIKNGERCHQEHD